MDHNLHPISALIRARRAIYPKSYREQIIPEEILLEVLENANWAPTHKMTEPWRFRVLRGKSLERLGEFLAGHYRTHTSEEAYSEQKYQKMLSNPSRAGAVIVVIMRRDPDERLPEWEEIAAVSAAVQNMWLTCTAHGIGAYWSTPSAITRPNEFLDLKEGERCLGLFYMGYHDMPELPGKRNPIEGKVEWLE